MLSPEQIEEAGERVAAVYREIEARMLDHLARAMAEGWEKSPRTVTEAALLAQSQAEELRRMVEEFRPNIDASVLEVVEECLEASDEDDVARAGGSPEWPAQIDATVKGMAEVLARDNIQMAEGAKQAFLGASIEAVTRVNAGEADREAALHRAVRKLERDGIDIITYQDADTGRVTVRNKADVAVRRHVRTQIVQDAQRMTMARMERLGIDLVEVSSHSDSRPSHAEWQGQCYSLRGEQVIDGTVYPDFYLHCMSGDLGDILGGVNCRHSYGPYRHGAPRMYEPDPQHPSGLPGAEVYELEQGQRYRERKIREAKRELRGAQVLYERDKSAANLDAVNKAGQKLRNRQEKMRAYIDGANAKSKTGKPVLHRKSDREWAGDMPKSKMPASANRTLPQLLGTPSARRAMAGLDKTAVTAAVGEEMARRGGTVAHFRSLSPGDQQGVLRGAIASVRAKADGTAKASRGAHAETLAGVVRGEPMGFDRANGGRVNPNFSKGEGYWVNCQTCVVAFEARLRGYDVVAKAKLGEHSAAGKLAKNTNLAWIDPATGDHPTYYEDPTARKADRFKVILESQIEQGGRYTMEFNWSKSKGGGGHIVSVDRTPEGVLRIYDPQSGEVFLDEDEVIKRYTPEEIEKRKKFYGPRSKMAKITEVVRNPVLEYLKDFRYETSVGRVKFADVPKLLRIDGMEFDRAIVDEILEGA